MAERKVDDYKSIKFYAENTKVKQAGFSKFQVGDDHYFCRYVDGKIAMLSQAYSGKSGRDNGIESVKKNEKNAKRFKFETRSGGKHGFALTAGNGQEIAISPNYATAAAAAGVSARLTGKAKAKAKVASATPIAKAAPAKKKAPVTAKAVKTTTAKPKAVQTSGTGSNEDNYMPIAFYKKNTKSQSNGFQTFQGDDEEHYFTFSENKKIALISEGYPTAAIRDKGMASVEKNVKLEKRYVYGKGADGKPGFALRAGNNKEIARSVGYGSVAAAAAGAAYLMGTRRRVAPKPKAKKSVAAAAVASVAAAKAAPKAKVRVTKVTPKKAAVAVKPKGTVPIKAAAIVAAPIAAVAVAAAAVVPKPAPEPVVAAPVMAAAPIPAPAAAGGGIWGWLKWLLLALGLLALLFLFKACLGGEKVTPAAVPVTVQKTAAPAALVTCWNGSKAKDNGACPTKITCWDNSFAVSDAACPIKPAPTPAPAPAPESKVMATAAPAPKMTAPSVAGRFCGPSSNALFNVSNMTPVNVTRLGTNPQFGNSLSLTPDGFYRKLQLAYETDREDRLFLDYVANSLGHGSFNNMDASMFSHDTLENGTSGLLGFSTDHALQFSTMNMSDPEHLEAFKVRSTNGTDVHFMKRCGNFMYVCQP